jgi:hypothetical protein
MTPGELTPAQLRERGYAALLRELGPVDFIRFMRQFESGQGDYTQDRAQWLDRLTPEQVNQIIDKQRAERAK